MEDKIEEFDLSTEVGKLKDVITILVDELERIFGEKDSVVRLLGDHGYDLCELGIVCPEDAKVNKLSEDYDSNLNESAGSFAVLITDEDGVSQTETFKTNADAQAFLQDEFLWQRQCLEEEGYNSAELEEFDDMVGYDPNTNTFNRDIVYFEAGEGTYDGLTTYELLTASKGKYIVYHTSSEYSRKSYDSEQFNSMAEAQTYLQDKFLECRDNKKSDVNFDLDVFDKEVGYDEKTNTFNKEITGFTTLVGDYFNLDEFDSYELCILK